MKRNNVFSKLNQEISNAISANVTLKNKENYYFAFFINMRMLSCANSCCWLGSLHITYCIRFAKLYEGLKFSTTTKRNCFCIHLTYGFLPRSFNIQDASGKSGKRDPSMMIRSGRRRHIPTAWCHRCLVADVIDRRWLKRLIAASFASPNRLQTDRTNLH